MGQAFFASKAPSNTHCSTERILATLRIEGFHSEEVDEKFNYKRAITHQAWVIKTGHRLHFG